MKTRVYTSNAGVGELNGAESFDRKSHFRIFPGNPIFSLKST